VKAAREAEERRQREKQREESWERREERREVEEKAEKAERRAEKPTHYHRKMLAEKPRPLSTSQWLPYLKEAFHTIPAYRRSPREELHPRKERKAGFMQQRRKLEASPGWRRKYRRKRIAATALKAVRPEISQTTTIPSCHSLENELRRLPAFSRRGVAAPSSVWLHRRKAAAEACGWLRYRLRLKPVSIRRNDYSEKCPVQWNSTSV